MKKKVLSFLLTLSLLASAVPAAFAAPAEGDAAEGGVSAQSDRGVPTESEAYQAMLSMKAEYPEKTPWTNKNEYEWHGGRGEPGPEIANIGAGCVGFAYMLSDKAFGELPGRMIFRGNFTFEDVRAGDILRVLETHSVIVLRTFDESVEVAEGNYHESGSDGFIHWGRILTKAEVEASVNLITRYPVDYVDPSDPGADDPIEGDNGEKSEGNIPNSSLHWKLTKAGTLTISGSGAMPDFTFGGSTTEILSDRPWNNYTDKVLKIVVEEGVTHIGDNAFRSCPGYSLTLPTSSIISIGNHAFQGIKIASVSVPSGVQSIGEDAFYGCTSLSSVNLPASITSVGSGAFSSCGTLESVAFAPSTNQVTMGDNVFTECFELSSLTLPQKMDRVTTGMFMNCHSLAHLTIPNGVTEIGQQAFATCRHLTSLTIPDSVKSIKTAAFSSTPLQDIYFTGNEEQWNSIEKIADVPTSLKGVTIHYNSTGPDTEAPTPGTLSADNFDFVLPANLVYDGSGKSAQVTAKSSLSGKVGAITVKYYSDPNGEALAAAPVNVGTYTVKIDVAATADYKAATGLVIGSFEIKQKPLSGSVMIAASNTDDGETITTGTVLTATVSANTAPSDTLSYQWYRGETQIENAAGKTYTLTSDDADESVITVKVTAGTNYSGELTSNSITVGKKVMTASVELSAATESDVTTLTATVTDDGNPVDYADLAGKGLELVWTRDGVPFDDDTAATYTVKNSDRGKAITVKLVPAGNSDYTGEVAAAGDGAPNLVNGVYTYPAVVPGAPTGLTAAAGDAKVVLQWTEPADNGGAEITGYKITVNSADTTSTVEVTGNVNSYTVSDLDNGTEYTFTVKAVNSVGEGEASNEAAATPEAGSTTPPTNPSGPSTPSRPSTPADPDEPDNPTPPPATGEDVSKVVTPEISDGTASAAVDQETADKLVSDAVENNSTNVTVKVDVPADADVTEVKADIPASAVADLASKTDAALTIETPMASVTLPSETLAQLGGTSGNVTVAAAVNEDNSVKVEVQSNGTTVGSLNGGMKVDLPVSQPADGTVAVLVDADGNETILPKSAVNGGEMAVLLENGSATIKFVDNSKQFADTDDHWAKSSIDFVSSHNLFQGMEENSFKADVPMNRAMLVTVLHRLESTPAAGSVSFDDVSSDSYYAAAAAWAASKGIVTGDGSGFSGDRNVTREEMAVMLYRYVQTINGNKGTLGSYSGMDGAGDVSGWADEAMRWAVGSGIISGDNNGSLNPGSTATRGEVSQMLMNFVKLITK